MRGSGGDGKRTKLSVAAGLKRALPMRWEFPWIGGLLRAGERLQRASVGGGRL